MDEIVFLQLLTNVAMNGSSRGRMGVNGIEGSGGVFRYAKASASLH